MNDQTPENQASNQLSGFANLNHEELLARGMMSEVFSGGMTDWQAPEPEVLELLLTGYEVIGFLGRGGMGAVYRVLQPDLERECALKLLPLEVSLAPGFEERFLREARAMAKLDHPNIVTIYDFGRTSEGHLYYVMECIEGMDLSALIKDGGLDLSGALDVVSQVCVALDYAHNEGYVHRDIKPANILVNTKGVVKVTDFGLAKLLDNNTPDYGMTMTGQVMGTPDYMSPEQAHGQPVDQRADIYALGVLLYEMLTGSLPKGIFAPPSQKVQVDVRLDEIVIRALQQEPEKRYQQASEIKTSIDQIRKDSTEGKTNIQEPETEIKLQPEPPLISEEYAEKLVKKKPPAFIYISAAVGFILLSTIAYFILKPKHSSPQTADTSAKKTLTADTSLWPVQDEKHTNTLGIPFVPVSGTDVLFSVWETRRKDWDKFLRETDYQWERPSFNGPGDHPAPNISWHDANAYCKWLTEKERASANIGPDMEYRLPTDLEWSAAVGLGKEEGEDPETRSAKVKGLYPWGKAWPAPDKIGKEIDSSPAITIARLIMLANEIATLSSKGKTDKNKIKKFKIDNFPKELVEEVMKLEPLFFDYPSEILSFTLPVNKIENYKDHKLLLLSKQTKGKTVNEMINIAGLKMAPWGDVEFRNGIKSGILFDKCGIYFWGGRVWHRAKQIDMWRTQDLGIPAGNDGVFKEDWRVRAATIVSIKNKDFNSKEQLRANIANRLLADWNKRCTKLLALLPKYENDWQQKIQPVDQLWENPFGIKGMAGSAREWVWDKYYDDDQFFGPRVLRGGCLRSNARGPEPLDMKHMHRGWKNPVDYFCLFTRDLKQELLASKRNSNQPHIRKSYYGFRPVLAFKKGLHPTSISDHNKKTRIVDGFNNSLNIKLIKYTTPNLLWAIHEVRNVDYLQYDKDWNYAKSETEKDGGEWGYHPVRNISWQKAHDFCSWLTEKERQSGTITKLQRYRLPTYEEWKILKKVEIKEPVVRVRYGSWSGNFTDATRSIYNKSFHHAYGPDGFVQTSPVGSFPPRSGFYDIAGNVSEWVTDDELEDNKSKRYVDTNFAMNGNHSDFQGGIVKNGTIKNPRIGFRIVLETLIK